MTKLPNTVGNSVYELLKRDIIRGTLAPGSKLKLDPLKTQYEASISTLRESLNRLGSEGFVRAEEQRGFFVTDVWKTYIVLRRLPKIFFVYTLIHIVWTNVTFIFRLLRASLIVAFGVIFIRRR